MKPVREYVVGFAFDSVGNVALIRKRRPAWQAGKLNGIGGHIESSDASPFAAMRREFQEEAGLDIDDWRLFCKLCGDTFAVYFFSARVRSFKHIRSVTDEQVVVVPLRELALDQWRCLPSLSWLVPMAIKMEYDAAGFFVVREEYAA